MGKQESYKLYSAFKWEKAREIKGKYKSYRDARKLESAVKGSSSWVRASCKQVASFMWREFARASLVALLACSVYVLGAAKRWDLSWVAASSSYLEANEKAPLRQGLT